MDNIDILKMIDTHIDSLETKIKKYSAIIKIGNIIKIILSASIPILVDRAAKNTDLLFVVSVSSAIITIIQSSISFLDFEDRNQAAIRMLFELKKEKLLYLTKTEPYNKSDSENFHLLVLNIQERLDTDLSEFTNND